MYFDVNRLIAGFSQVEEYIVEVKTFSGEQTYSVTNIFFLNILSPFLTLRM
jgi:hypothetical protein